MSQPVPPPDTPPDQEEPLALPQGLALPPKLSERLSAIVDSFQDRPVSFRELYQIAEGGALSMILILINLPYIVPIPLPGLAVITGLVTAFIGARMALRQHPWLPERLLNAQLPARMLPSLLKGAVKVLRLAERFLKPRLRMVHENLVFHQINGGVICLCGILLLLPIPSIVPLTNFLPAVAVLLIAAGTMERDGFFVLAGYAFFLISAAYFAFIAFGGIKFFEWTYEWIKAWFTS